MRVATERMKMRIFRMRMMNKRRMIGYTMRAFAALPVLIFFAAGLFLVSPVLAADELDLDRNDDEWFGVENMMPGESATEEFCAQNDHATEAGDYFLNIDDVADGDLANRLKFYLRDKSSGKYLIGGSGDRFTVDEMNSAGDVFIERLEPGEENCYSMKIKFDEDAGDDFQDREVTFDFNFTLVSEVAAGVTPPFRLGVPEGGVEPTPEEIAEDFPAVAGAETAEEGEVAGAAGTAACTSWPLWAWILLLVAHTGITNVKQLFHGLVIRQWGSALQAGSAAGALLSWYLYDGCRSYSPEIPIAIMVISAASSLLSFRWRGVPGE